MSKLEHALDGAIALLQEGNSLEEALNHYPELRQELAPLLAATLQVRKVELGATPAFKARSRAQLLGHIAAHPRQRPSSGLLRFAVGLATVALALTSATTAMAQSSLPGHTLHPVKLYSEQVWRALHSNPIQADLAIAQRRLEELLAVQSEQVPDALSAYAASLEVLRRDVEALPDRALSAQTVLHAQRQQVQQVLEAVGSTSDDVFTIMPTLDQLITANPTQVPLTTPTQPVQLVVPVIPSLAVSISVSGGGNETAVEVTTSGNEQSRSSGLDLNLAVDIMEPVKSLMDSMFRSAAP